MPSSPFLTISIEPFFLVLATVNLTVSICLVIDTGYSFPFNVYLSGALISLITYSANGNTPVSAIPFSSVVIVFTLSPLVFLTSNSAPFNGFWVSPSIFKIWIFPLIWVSVISTVDTLLGFTVTLTGLVIK